MANQEGPVERFNTKVITLLDDHNWAAAPPATDVSGAAIYMSGGHIYGKGAAGTITEIAAT